MLGTITGQRLMLAKMHIANYIIDQMERAGGGNVSYMVSNLNAEYGIVAPADLPFFIQDIGLFCDALMNQSVTEIDRAAYWKFRAMSAIDAKRALETELNALRG
ncbi:hypothetical protein [Azospirillum argentinense]|uniref:hypothetical protein n=1 Tax=Azospirillum argentinense TaxID=2970906 RepID=UPI0032DE555D